MEKRAIIAFALAIIFFTLWSRFFFAKPVPPQAAPETAVTAPEAPAEAALETTAPAAAPAGAPAPEAAPQPAVSPAPEAAGLIPDKYRQENIKAEDITISSDLLTVTFTPGGGAIRSLVLNRYRDFDQTGPLVLLTDFAEGQFPTEITRVSGQDTAGRLYALESVAGADDPAAPKTVSFATVLPSGVKLTKTYTLQPGKYGVELAVVLENLAGAPAAVSYDILGPVGMPSEDFNRTDVAGVLAAVPEAEGLAGKMTLQVVAAQELMKKGDVASAPGMRATYAGALNRYFAAVLRPEYDPQRLPLAGTTIFPVGDRLAGARFSVDAVTLAPAGAQGASITQSYLLFTGPKENEALAGFNTPQMQTNFVALLNYGWLEPLVKVVLWIMNAFHHVIPNWGVAIILLTLLVRLAMHPLTRKSQISMAKMQKLQPHITKLKEKYKNDKQRLGAEQMKLMKEHGANPLGGCLPMLIQLPIFFALYRALTVSVDLRHAPFMLWITDLAQPDRLAQLPLSLPLVGSWINLLPILMVAAMVAQQKLTPQATTPEAAQQQKIMMIFMPAFMGVILYNFAAGLNLYILTSTVAGMTESWFIKRHLAAQEEPAA